MKIPHFFKARSRVGLIREPIHQKELNVGVEWGGDALLTPNFLQHFFNPPTHIFDFPSPEQIDKEKYFSIIADIFDKFADQINSFLKTGETQVVLGGDNCVSFLSVLALLRRSKNPDSVGYIQFDSHGDLNQMAESPTGNFHGMYVRALVDNFDVPEIERLVPKKIPPKNLFYIGNLDLDDGEKSFFKKNDTLFLDGDALNNDFPHSLSKIEEFAKRFEHIHVNVDIDVLDKSEAPSTGIPAERGLFLREIIPLLKILSNHGSISVDLSEVNPRKPGFEKTLQSTEAILLAVLGR